MGVTYHLISRFIERTWFITSPSERQLYLELQRRALERTDWRLLGYAIMSNHIHLVALAGGQPLARWLRPVHSPFADALNQAHQRIGPIFVRGPKAYAVEDGRVGRLLAYVHNNPVRANVCATAGESAWTSHGAYVSQADTPWLHVRLGLALTGVTSGEDFDRWVNDPDRRTESFSQSTHELERKLATNTARTEQEDDELAAAIIETLASVMGVPSTALRGSSRGHVETAARAAASRCSLLLGVTEQTIANELNISQQRVSVLRRQVPSDAIRDLAACVVDRLGEAK